VIALSVAIVVVALVARDVVLRLHEKRARSADVAQVVAALDAETARLSDTRAEMARMSERHDQLVRNLDGIVSRLEAEVATLKMNAGLRGKR
jgi:uncharacterized protein YlxW (UPF0749 family)